MPLECSGARVAKLPGELQPEGVGAVMPHSGLKVCCFASNNTAISICMIFYFEGGVSEPGRIRQEGELKETRILSRL